VDGRRIRINKTADMNLISGIVWIGPDSHCKTVVKPCCDKFHLLAEDIAFTTRGRLIFVRGLRARSSTVSTDYGFNMGYCVVNPFLTCS